MCLYVTTDSHEYYVGAPHLRFMCMTKFLQIARCAAPFCGTESQNICSI